MLAGAAIRRAAPGSHGYFYYAVVIRPAEPPGQGPLDGLARRAGSAVAAIEPLCQARERSGNFQRKIVFLPAIYQDAHAPRRG